MTWVKKGRIFAPQRRGKWMVSHAAVPVADRIGEDRYRVFFTARDGFNRSHVGYFEFDLSDPQKVLRVSEEPVLGPGSLGTFDEDGSMGCSLLNYQGRKYLYYTGWNRAQSVPFRNAIGLAVSVDGGESFSRYSAGPLLDRGIHDPCSLGTPCVRVEDGCWSMWYLTCSKWAVENAKLRHYYHIAYASSRDGIDWYRDGRVCIGFESPGEYAIARPSVIKTGSGYKMWYSVRGDRYRIGYAESSDGIQWVRRDRACGLEPSAAGWDSEMVEYPFVFSHCNTCYLLYNGNGYGRSGIGLAVLSD